MHSIAKGDISTAIITARLLQKGYTVLRPVTELSRYDLVIDRGRGFERVQCKTGRLRSGAIRFNTSSSLAHHGRDNTRRPYSGEIELFGVYCMDLDTAFLVPVDEVGTTEGSLRVAPTKNNQSANVRAADDYRL